MTRRMVWIGCGRHAEQMLLPQLMRQDVALVGVCDINPEAARGIARRYGIAQVATDYRDLLNLPAIDVVGMAVGPDAHRVMALAALERGCHVFMEKPCGATAADAVVIRDAARRAGKVVGVGFMKRFAAANRMAWNVVHGRGSGERARERFGAVVGLFCEYMTAPAYFANPQATYDSFYLHHCIHSMDLVRHFAGDVRELSVFRHEIAPGKLLLHVHLGFAEGAVGTLVIGTIQSRGTPVERLQIMGDHRRVEVDGVIGIRFFRDPPFKADDPAATLADAVDTLCWTPNFTAAVNEDFKGYHPMLTAFFGLLDGQATGMPTIDDGVAAMRLLDALVTGAQAPGKTVTIETQA